MIIASFLIALQAKSQPRPNLDWVAALQKTPQVRRLIEDMPRTQPAPVAEPAGKTPSGEIGEQTESNSNQIISARKPGVPLGDIIQSHVMEARARARVMERNGDPEAAIQLLRNAYEQYPRGQIGTLITQIELRSHLYQAALKDIFELRQNNDDSALLRIALVTSLNGDVVPGERDYCIYHIRHDNAAEAMDEITAALPEGESPRAITALSAEALAWKEGANDYEAGIFDAELANEINPGNPAVLLTLSNLYRHAARFLDAEKAAQAASKISSSRYLRQICSNEISDDSNAVKKFGAVGKPSYIPDPVKPNTSP